MRAQLRELPHAPPRATGTALAGDRGAGMARAAVVLVAVLLAGSAAAMDAGDKLRPYSRRSSGST